MTSRSSLSALALCVLALSAPAPLLADEAPAADPATPVDPNDPANAPPEEADAVLEEEEYRAIRAGEPFKRRVFGRTVERPARDRRRVAAVDLGLLGFSPRLGNTQVTPFGAIYVRSIDDRKRIRGTFAGVVNDVDLGLELGLGFRALAYLANNTVPLGRNEIVQGESLDSTALEWGSSQIWLGAGHAWDVWPWNFESEVRIEAFYAAGYEYHDRVDDTPDSLRVATDTVFHGPRLRLRLDALERNLLELPHLGLAGGADLAWRRRDRWREYGLASGRSVDADDTRDAATLSGYLLGARPVPGLDERHRLLLTAHGGFAFAGRLDRFTAFRLGGGPYPSEYRDLSRRVLPGAGFDLLPMERYVMATAEYRAELLFFLFAHLRMTYVRGRLATLASVRGRRERSVEGYVTSVALTSGFLWESQVHIEVAYDWSGVLRGGEEGATIMLQWAKSF